MIIQKAQRKRSKLRLSIQGPSGSGKTYGSLLLAYGLCTSFSKVCLIDTEHRSGELYSHLGDYNTLQLSAPFNPEKFIEAIHLCEKEGMEVIIIDSASHEWDGLGGILDIHSAIPGNSFTAWSKVTPRHNSFVQAILNSSCHIITTVRSKQEYVLSDKNGKSVPEKVGMKGIQRDGYEYESTVAFELTHNHSVMVSKDRTGLFTGKHDIVLSPEIGKKLKEWCEQGEEITVDDISRRIGECKTIQELLALYKEDHPYKEVLRSEFEAQKRRIIINQEVKSDLLTQPISYNGTE